MRRHSSSTLSTNSPSPRSSARGIWNGGCVVAISRRLRRGRINHVVDFILGGCPRLTPSRHCTDMQRCVRRLVTLPTVAFSADFARSTAQSVGILMRNAGSVNQVEIEHFEEVQPSRLLADWFGRRSEKRQGGMVRPQNEMSTQQILSELLQAEDGRQHLTTSDTVVGFRSIERPTGVGYDSEMCIRDRRNVDPANIV